jgi:hypothetical protein
MIKAFFRQPLKVLAIRLLMSGVSLLCILWALRNYIIALGQGAWFFAGINALALLMNVFSMLVNLGITKLPWPKPKKTRVEVTVKIMQAYPPLAADHPLVTDATMHCCLCEKRFMVGEITTLISKEKPEIGKTVEALPAHACCVQMAMTNGRVE